MTELETRVAPHPVLAEYYGSEQDRRERVDAMFNASAVHYDWINSMMSFGTGEWYRRDALTRLGFEPGMQALDAGSGTGVVASIVQELVGQVTVGSMDFHPIKACFNCIFCRSPVILPNLLDLIDSKSPRC